jgi:hypothetical protein
LVGLAEGSKLSEAEGAFEARSQRRAVARLGTVHFVALVTQQVAPPKPSECSNGHVGGDVLEFGSVGSGERMKGGGCIISRERENTVRDGDVVVDVEIEATAKSLRK